MHTNTVIFVGVSKALHLHTKNEAWCMTSIDFGRMRFFSLWCVVNRWNVLISTVNFRLLFGCVLDWISFKVLLFFCLGGENVNSLKSLDVLHIYIFFGVYRQKNVCRIGFARIWSSIFPNSHTHLYGQLNTHTHTHTSYPYLLPVFNLTFYQVKALNE